MAETRGKKDAAATATWFHKGHGSIKGWIPFSANGINLRNTAEKYVPFGSDGTRLQWLEQHADAYSLVISATRHTDYEAAFAAFELLREFAAEKNWLDFEALALVGFMLMAWRKNEDEVLWPARCSALQDGGAVHRTMKYNDYREMIFQVLEDRPEPGPYAWLAKARASHHTGDYWNFIAEAEPHKCWEGVLGSYMEAFALCRAQSEHTASARLEA